MKKPIIDLKTLHHVDKVDLVYDARFDHARITSVEYVGAKARDVTCETVIMEKIDFGSSNLPGLKLLDARLSGSSFANAACEDVHALRAEFIGCRLTGLQAPNGMLREVLFQRCKLDLSLFRFASFREVVFEECVLRGADFVGAAFDRVTFKSCDLTGTDFSQSKIRSIDLRGSNLQDIRLDKHAIAGTIKVDTGQALYLAGLFGLIIED